MTRWAMRIGAGVLGLAVLAVLALYGVSEAMIRKTYDPPMVQVRAATGPEAIARGQHLAQVYGCSGCHGRELHGEQWQADPMHGTLWTANLTRAMPLYSDAELARAIREGVRHDGRGLWGMPSESWIAVTDAEMGDLLAWLRTHKPSGKPTPAPSFGPLGRLSIILDRARTTPRYVTEAREKPALEVGADFATGRHLAQTVCSECHGSDLKGRPGETPDLMIAASYDAAGFTQLMRTGIAADGKEKGLMTEVARGRFLHLTDAELAALYAYLRKRAEETP